MWKLQVDWPKFSVPPSYRSVPEGTLPHGATVNFFIVYVNIHYTCNK